MTTLPVSARDVGIAVLAVPRVREVRIDEHPESRSITVIVKANLGWLFRGRRRDQVEGRVLTAAVLALPAHVPVDDVIVFPRPWF